MRVRLTSLAIVLPIAVAVACTATTGSKFGDDDNNNNNNSGTSTGQGGFDLNGTNSETLPSDCGTDQNVDDDGDGYSEAQGDCNDCDPNTNPGSVEVMTQDGEAGDEDCDGQIDEPPDTCDQGLAVGDSDPLNAAKAIDLCKMSDNGSWGVIGAKYVRADGNPTGAGLGNGLVAQFGSSIKPQLGGSMLVLSSGNARDMSAGDACGSQTCMTSGPGMAPQGFPQDVPGCQGMQEINDDIGLDVEIKAPGNAQGYSFNFAFMSFEFSEYVCTSFNDQFIALVSPPPQGSVNGNISFDSQTNPVSVNIALFDHCDPSTLGSYAMFCGGGCPSPPNPNCPNGAGFMAGTGFNEWGDSGSTGWLVTTAPIAGGETFKIRFAIWDTGDQALDSTVVIDNFRWTATPGTGIGTKPIPDPK